MTVATTDANPPVAPSTESRGNCLIKEYLRDGRAVFKDICTMESAVTAPMNENENFRNAQ
jgi:hypothetical protein